MLLTTDYVLPEELTGYVRTALADLAVNKFQLAQWLPNDNVDDIVYRMLAGGTGLTEAASFRTWDAESKIGRTQPINRLIGELPPISQKIRLSEYDRIRSRKLTDEKVRDQIFNDADIVADQISARIELARADALMNGSVTLSEAGNAVVDYGRSSSCNITVGTLWSNTSSDPLSDLMSARDVYLGLNGVDPGAMLISRRVWNTLLRNQAVRNQIFPGVQQPTVVQQDMLNAMLEANGLPPVTQYQAQVLNNGSAQKILADNIVLFLPPAGDPNDAQSTQLGATLWGPTSESFEPEYNLTDDESGIVAGVYKSEDPVSLWTKAAAVSLPVLANPNLSMKITVL